MKNKSIKHSPPNKTSPKHTGENVAADKFHGIKSFASLNVGKKAISVMRSRPKTTTAVAATLAAAGAGFLASRLVKSNARR